MGGMKVILEGREPPGGGKTGGSPYLSVIVATLSHRDCPQAPIPLAKSANCSAYCLAIPDPSMDVRIAHVQGGG